MDRCNCKLFCTKKTPILFQTIQTLCRKLILGQLLKIFQQLCLLAADLGRFEWVVWRERDVQEEDASLVHGARGSQDGRPPLVDVVSFRASARELKQKTC